MMIYCLKCKTKTDTKNIKQSITKNNKKMLQGNCSICNCKKSQFVKTENLKKTKKVK